MKIFIKFLQNTPQRRNKKGGIYLILKKFLTKIKNQTFCLKPSNNGNEFGFKIDFKPFITERE